MRVTCLQMDMKLGKVTENFSHAEKLIRASLCDKPDVIVLPETFNTGFFPKENLRDLCCNNGDTVKSKIGGLAKEYRVNIVAGSVSNLREDNVWNTSLIFDRNGECIAEYDKTHLFTPMGENSCYTHGDRLCTFTLDNVKCGVIICYDLRFPELTRSLVLQGMDMLFVVSQWPYERISHLQSLITARAIENQIFVVCCNSCGTAYKTRFGGNSAIIDPLGKTLSLGGEKEQVLTADCDMHMLTQIRGSIPVMKDRRPALYNI